MATSIQAASSRCNGKEILQYSCFSKPRSTRWKREGKILDSRTEIGLRLPEPRERPLPLRLRVSATVVVPRPCSAYTMAATEKDQNRKVCQPFTAMDFVLAFLIFIFLTSDLCNCV